MSKNSSRSKSFLPVALVAGLGAVAFFIMQKRKYIQAAKQLTAGIDGISLDSKKTKLANYLTLYLKIRLAINNQNKTNFSLTGINLNFFNGNKMIANAKDTGAINIKPEAVTKATFTISIDTGKIFTLITDAIKIITLKQNFNVGIKGEIETTAGIIKIDEQKAVEWPT